MLSLKKVEKGIRYTGTALAFISGFLFVLLMLLDTSDVIGRYVFNSPIIGTYEISGVLMGGIILLAWAYTQKRGGNVLVDMFINRFSSRVRALLNFVTLFLSLALFSAITWQSAIIAVQRWHEHRVFPTLQLTSVPYYFFVPVGAFFLCLEFIIEMIQLIPQMREGA